jgi:hypothetical protein
VCHHAHRLCLKPVFLNYAVSFATGLPSYATSETGTATFFDGSSQIGTGSVTDGSATLVAAALAA